MATPKGGYWLEGKRLPSVTTVLNRFKDSGGLIHWAWEQGRDGKDYRETKQAAADAGTIVHEYIEADWRGTPFNKLTYPADLYVRADGAIRAYIAWKQQTGLRVVSGEEPLISKDYLFGGTPDALLVQSQLCIGDWKSANAVYADNLMQLAAYQHLWETNHPDQLITGGFHLLRLNKPEHPDDPVSFEHRYWSQLNLAWEQFKLLLAAYQNDKRLKALV